MAVLSSSPWSDRALSVLRVVVGLLFLVHGTMKVFGYPPSPAPMPIFDISSQLGMAGLLEVVGGALMTLGLLTRPVAFLLAGEMAVAYFQVHLPQSFWPALNNGEPAVLFCGLFLYFVFAGGGAWSIDRALEMRRFHSHHVSSHMHPSPAR